MLENRVERERNGDGGFLDGGLGVWLRMCERGKDGREWGVGRKEMGGEILVEKVQEGWILVRGLFWLHYLLT